MTIIAKWVVTKERVTIISKWVVTKILGAGEVFELKFKDLIGLMPCLVAMA